MPIWKYTTYFDSPTKDVNNGEPKTADDAQKHVEDSPNNKNVEQDKFADDSTTHIESFSDEDESEVDLGNITNSYTVPTTLNIRIHKDHPIDNVIGDIEPPIILKLYLIHPGREAMRKTLYNSTSTSLDTGLKEVKHIEDLMLNASPLKQKINLYYCQSKVNAVENQHGGPPEKVGDEAVHKELGDRMERAVTTASSLEAEQDSERRDDELIFDTGVLDADNALEAKPKARGVVVQEPSEFRAPQEAQPSISKDKGKGIMIEPEVPLKRKDQKIALDELNCKEIFKLMMELIDLLAETTNQEKEGVDQMRKKEPTIIELMEKMRKTFCCHSVAQEKRNRPTCQ
ncbi:hypothetical protein Tco_1209758 [Tanacetum coccineum]